jgi:hypothetical protein
MNLQNFKLFLEFEEKNNVKKTVKGLPQGHQDLLKGYKINFTARNTLNGDNQHIGFIYKNKIEICAPWRYSREFTMLHEIGHLVYEKLMTPELKKEWAKTVKKNPKENQDNNEENFCMAYAATYSKHAPVTHAHPAWIKFIKERVPNEKT